MKPTHFELMAKTMAIGLDTKEGLETLHPYVCRLFDLIDDHLEFGEANDKGQEVSVVGLDALRDKFKKENNGKDEWIYSMLMESMFTTMSMLMVSLYKFHKYGHKAFHFNRGITELLHNTDLAGTYEFLKCPYQSLYISFDGCPIWIDVGDDHEKVAGVYVDSSRDDLISFLSISNPSPDHLGSSVWVRASISNHNRSSDRISMDDFNFGGAEHNPAIELAVKSLLYLNSDSPDIIKGGSERRRITSSLMKAKEPKKKKRLERQLRQLSINEYLDIGSNIKVHKNETSSVSKNAFDGGYHYSYRFWTRGHFRNQAYGQGGLKRKLIWIKPFMKGPDQAEVLHKKYKVEGK